MSKGTPWEGDRAAVKRDYQLGMNISQLAAKYGLDRKTIRTWAQKEGWYNRPPDQDPVVQSAKKAIAIAERKMAAERPPEEMAAEILAKKSEWLAQVADRRLEAAVRHFARNQRLGDVLTTLMQNIEIWLTGEAKEKAKVAEVLFPTKGDSLTGHVKLLIAMTSELQHLDRQVLGMDATKKQPTLPDPPQVPGAEQPGTPEITTLSDELLDQLRRVADALARQRPEAATH